MAQPLKLELQLETVTPLFLGGSEPRGQPELRPPSFKGELRFWWRALWGGVHPQSRVDDLYKAESALFGNTDGASPIVLRLSDAPTEVGPWRFEQSPGVDYLFFAFKANRQDPERNGFKAEQSFKFGLHTRLGAFRLDSEAEQSFRQACAALWLMVRLGGVGARSRRGAGGLKVSGEAQGWPTDFPPLAVHARSAAEFAKEQSDGLRQLYRALDWPLPVANLKRWPEFDILHPQGSPLYILGKAWPTWQAALNEVGDAYRNFRSRRDPDYGNVKPVVAGTTTHLDPVERAAFGLPIVFYYRSLRVDKAVHWKARQADRRASPLMFHVTRLANGDYVVHFTSSMRVCCPWGVETETQAKRQTGLCQSARRRSNHAVPRSDWQAGTHRQTRRSIHRAPLRYALSPAGGDSMTDQRQDPAALLVFGIGPVQDFIATARRTQDLWMGSYILSYLMAEAMRVVTADDLAQIETGSYQSDRIIFPIAEGQPLLAKLRDRRAPVDHVLTLASLPNKFTAHVDSLADGVARATAAQRRVYDKWNDVAQHVAAKFPGALRQASKDWEKLWQEQIDPQRWIEVYWTVYPNTSQEYAELSEHAEQAFEARKRVREFEQTAERGEKCTVCGTRSALSTAPDQVRSVLRKEWAALAHALDDRNEDHDQAYQGLAAALDGEGDERLCAVCISKRFAQRFFFEAELGLHGGFPSTSSVATVKFREALLAPAFQAARSDFVRVMHGKNGKRGQRVPETLAVNAFPPLTQQHPGADLLKFDGDLFLPETYTRARLKDDYGLEVDDARVGETQGGAAPAAE